VPNQPVQRLADYAVLHGHTAASLARLGDAEWKALCDAAGMTFDAGICALAVDELVHREERD